MSSSPMSDVLLAQLLEMGFETDLVAACQIAMSSSSTPITLQSATEWLLQQSTSNQRNIGNHQTVTPKLRLGSSSSTTPPVNESSSAANPSGITQPLSSGSSLTYSEPLRSRYDLDDEKRKQKEALIAKERDDAVRKARERRLADMKAKALVKQKIEEDKLKRLEKTGSKSAAPVSPKSKPKEQLQPKSTSNKGQSRVQVRLPNGTVLRHVFPVEATLNDVCHYITQTNPKLTNISLVQPFPHKDFTGQEHSQSLESLGLCPSASLVVSKTKLPKEDEKMETSATSNEDMEVNEDDFSVSPVSPGGPPGGILPPPALPDGPRGMIPPGGPGRFLPPRGMPPPGGILPPRPVLPGGPRGMPPGRFLPPGGVPPPGGIFHGHQIGMSFEGEGHRLGGREAPVKFGSSSISRSARNAAEERAKMLSKMISEDRASKLSHDIPKLEVLCLRGLARWSSVDWLPNCSHLSPRVAQRLLTALVEAKQLHPKTLNVFLKCPLQFMKLDNYCYATNQLIEMFRYFPTLTHLSLVSCTLVTDKSMSLLLPYLPQLSYLNLNGCHQLSDVIFESFRGQNSLNTIRLSHLKLTDTGILYLTRQPLQNLEEIDISFTDITTNTLERLRQSAPNIKILNIESTKVLDVTSLLQLYHLHTLNISQCFLEGNVGILGSCLSLRNLNLSGIIVDTLQLTLLSNLHLSSLTLPDRNSFFDEHMEIVAGFPLEVLNLTGYCNVTDVGISQISRMEMITHLSLNRTHLTDEGMPYIEGLINLRQLSLDTTHITDVGMMSVKGLEQLEDLSVSDTKVASQFILNGSLSRLFKLSKLNLIRTFVDDKGLLCLNLPSLQMLNIDWTCASTQITIELLREKGCRSLETLRNHNIGQPTLEQRLQQQQQQQQVPPGGLGQPHVGGGPLPAYDSMEEDENSHSD